MRSNGLLYVAAATVALAACGNDDSTGPAGVTPNPNVVLTNRSVTPALIKGLPPGVQAYSLISSDDVLPQSPNFVFGGSADGAGLLKQPDGSFVLLTHHEDNFAVARIHLDRTFKPVRGEYLINSTVGQWRLCSATLAMPQEHGFGPTFLTVGESGQESMVHAGNPFGAIGQTKLLAAFGRWSTENTVPLPTVAYPGRTVIIGGDDDFGSPDGGQVCLCVSNTVGDLDGGRLYTLARADNMTREWALQLGQSLNIEFRELTASEGLTGAQIAQRTMQRNAIRFGRVEALDYTKAGPNRGREIYFNVTGEPVAGQNADSSRTRAGRVYTLTLSPNDPTRGTLEGILDGDAAGSTAANLRFQNPDNILVTENYVYIQEDPNGSGTGTHDAYIHQYNLNTRQVTVVAELDHRRGETKYNSATGQSPLGSWEYGAMLDISETIGRPSTFMIALQPHTWRGDRYRNADGGPLRPNENQASSWVVVTGLPR